MGKKRITTSAVKEENASTQGVASVKKSKKSVLKGTVYITSSYNNTIVSVTDANGNVFAWSSAGSIGFKGTRKSTPYAATLVGKDAMDKAKRFGFQEGRIIVSGIGPGREAAIRGVAGSGISITSIIDDTPLPHNGVRPPKPRRV